MDERNKYNWERIHNLLNNSNISLGDLDNLTITIAPDGVCYDLLTASLAVRYTEKICACLTFVLVFVGLVGNFLSGLVFSSAAMRNGPCNIFLLVLAVSDSTYLVAIFMARVLPSLRCLTFASSALDLFNKYDFFCKLLQYLMDFSANYSSCLILAFTAERLLAVYRPVKFKSLSNARMSKYACFGLLVAIAVTILPYHLMFISVSVDMTCTMSLTHEHLFSDLYIAEISIFRIVPVFLIAAFNLSIILKLMHQPEAMNDRRRRHVSTQIALNSSSNPAEVVELVEAPRVTRADRNQQVTVMLVLVSTSYILTYIPVLVHFMLGKLDRKAAIDLGADSMWMAASITRTLYVVGFVINFFLYTVSGRVFREQLVIILCKCIPKKQNVVKQTTQTNGNGRMTTDPAGEVTTVV